MRPVLRGLYLSAVGFLVVSSLAGEQAPSDPKAVEPPVTVEPGTKIPLSLLNTVSTKHSVEGDRVYLQTVFPVLSQGKVVIPPGSYVLGTVTQLKRPGKVKGKGELYLRFDSLTLPNGVVRDFRARVSALDGDGNEELDRNEGKIKSEGNVGGDMRTIGEAAAAGASLGTLTGLATDRYGLGAGVGAGAGAAAGLLGVLLTRGPDATLAQGTTIEMVLDRQLTFQGDELNFGPLQPTRITQGVTTSPTRNNDSRFPRKGFPF